MAGLPASTHTSRGASRRAKSGGVGEALARAYRSPRLIAVLIVVGASLRLIQYLWNRSLWLDEARLALYVTGRSFTGLLEPLEGIPGTHVQSAPLGFLMIEKLVTLVAGTSEPALRLLPLACGIAALPLFSRLALRLLAPTAVPVAMLLFAVSPYLVLYASEAKQYAGDVLAAVIVLLALLPASGGDPDTAAAVEPAAATERPATGSALRLAAIGAVLILCSHPVIFVLAAAGLVAAGRAWRRHDRRSLVRLTQAACVWVGAFAVGFALTVRHATGSAMLQRYWSAAFMPWPPLSAESLRWLVDRLVDLFAAPVGFVPPLLGAALFTIGVAAMARRRPGDVAALLLPGMLALLASSLHLYPFTGRLLLFFVPMVVLLLATGIERVSASLGRISPAFGVAVGILAVSGVVVQAVVASGAPMRPDETREFLGHVRAHWRPGDVLVVPPQGRAGFLYYAHRYGFGAADAILVESNRDWPRALDGIGGGRVWVGLPRKGLPRSRPLPAGKILARLSARGHEVERFETPDMTGYLYAVSGPVVPAGPAADAAAPGGEAPGGSTYNVLFVSVDSLRADHLGCYGYARDTSPAVDRLAREGVLFETVVADSSWTLPTHATMLTGLPQGVHGVRRGRARLDDAIVTLPEVLRRAGYRTRGFWSGPYLHPVFGFGQGFAPGDYEGVLGEICYDTAEFAASGDVKRERAVENTHRLAHRSVTSPELLRRAVAFLEQAGDTPFFLFVHFFDVHYDYVPPESCWRRFDPDYDGSVSGRDYDRTVRRDMDARDLQHVIALYDGEIRFTDEHIGGLLDALDRLELTSRTLVVLTADHGEEFFEHGEKGHRNNLYDETLLVPLVLRLPGVLPAGARVAEQVRQIDLMPTVLDLLGLPVPPGVMGSTMLDVVRGGVPPPRRARALARLVRRGDAGRRSVTALRLGRTKVVRTEEGGTERLEVYDLGLDPGEQAPLDGTARERALPDAERALGEMVEEEARVRRELGLTEGPAAPLPADVEDALRALGYLH